MSLPAFSDIGKQAKDLFEKNFYFGHVKLDFKNELTGSMSCLGTQKFNFSDSKMSGEFEGKYEGGGICIKPKVTTDAVLSGEFKLDNVKIDGLDIIGTGIYNAHENKKSSTMGFSYKTNDYNIECCGLYNDPNMKHNGLAFRTNGVMNLFGWLFGASFVGDPNAHKLMKTNLIGGFQDSRFSFFVNCDPQNHQVSGSVFNLVNSNIQTGLVYNLGNNSNAEAAKEAGGSQPNLAFCANYVLNDGATLKARINTDYLIGLSYILRIKNGINITLCTEVDAHKIKQGGHKLGLGVEFN